MGWTGVWRARLVSVCRVGLLDDGMGKDGERAGICCVMCDAGEGLCVVG